jgi:uncharacterized membrane protein YfcA
MRPIVKDERDRRLTENTWYVIDVAKDCVMIAALGGLFVLLGRAGASENVAVIVALTVIVIPYLWVDRAWRRRKPPATSPGDWPILPSLVLIGAGLVSSYAFLVGNDHLLNTVGLVGLCAAGYISLRTRLSRRRANSAGDRPRWL